jgi:hypothetical protein
MCENQENKKEKREEERKESGPSKPNLTSSMYTRYFSRKMIHRDVGLYTVWWVRTWCVMVDYVYGVMGYEMVWKLLIKSLCVCEYVWFYHCWIYLYWLITKLLMAVIFFCLSWKLSFGFLYYELCIYMMQSSEITVDLGCDLSCCSEIIISCTHTHTQDISTFWLTLRQERSRSLN